MAFKLPRFNDKVSLTNPNGTPSIAYHQWWQSVVEKLEEQVNSLEQVVEDLQDTVTKLRRINSHTEPTTILSAADNGATCTISVLAHTRVYGDATTLAVAGTIVPGLTSGTWYACYYDDTSLSNPNPTYVFTTDLTLAQSVKAPGRHFCGLIKTPVAASSQIIESGGVYPVGGGTVGGELL